MCGSLFPFESVGLAVRFYVESVGCVVRDQHRLMVTSRFGCIQMHPQQTITRALQPFGDDRSSSSVRALSCVLWSMLTGKRFCSRISNMPSRLPFRNASELSYLYRHGFEGDGSVSSLPPVNVVGTRAPTAWLTPGWRNMATHQRRC